MSEERNYELYKVTSPDSPKFYIGVTCSGVGRRFANHKSLAKRHKKKHRFYYWLKKHINTAAIVPILVNLTKDVALELERITVDLCFKYEPDFILNTAPGGGRGPCLKGRKLSSDTKAKISASNMGRKVSKETRAKISAAKMGKMKGVPIHPNTLAAIISRRRAVVNDSGAEFTSSIEAAREMGMHDESVRNAIRKGCRAGGYRWSYKK